MVGWGMRWAALLLFSLFFAVGCDDSESEDRTCISDSDCKKVNSCCDGCLAVNVSVSFDTCDAQCVQAACNSTQQTDHVATCRGGQCTLVAPTSR